MQTNGAHRRTAVTGLLLATALLAPAAGWGGWTLGRELADDTAPVAQAAPAATAPSPAASPSAPPSPTAAPSPEAGPGQLSEQARELARQASVRLAPPAGDWSGSGSVVSADGLVLTNAHVADPAAPGLAAQYDEETLPGLAPDHLVVSTTEGDGPATPAYRARTLAVDGHLDLAVLRIVALADGSPLPAGLRLPFVPLGSVTDLALGDDLTVYGFPALNSGDLLTVRRGVVGTFLPDPTGRVPGARYTVETSADFSGGNSGGMALSDDGRLVGVPSSVLTTSELAQAHNVRAVDLAEPLLAAARSGAAYRSPYVVESTGRESGEDLGWTDEGTCSAPGRDVFDDQDEYAVGRVRLDGTAPDEDVLMVLRDGGAVVRVLATTADDDAGCLGIPLPTDGDGGLVPGSYRLEVLVGPDRTPVVASSVVVEATGD